MKIACVIWTHNPDTKLFSLVLHRASHNVAKVYVIDNGSNNYEELNRIASSYNNVELYRLSKNLGVKALNIGLTLAIKNGYEWILILDDDSVLDFDAIREIQREYERINSLIKQKIGVMSITDLQSLPLLLRKWVHLNINKVYGKFIQHTYPMIFSGSIIRASVILSDNIKIDEKLFLDHADTIFFENIRSCGYYTLTYVKRLMKHRMGLRTSKPIRFLNINFNRITTPPRFYYIVRNSVYLLLRGKLSPIHFILTVMSYLPVLFTSSRMKYIKYAMMGLSHGIFAKLGIFIEKELRQVQS